MMINYFIKVLVAIIITTTLASCMNLERIPSTEQVKGITQKVADWQIKTYEDQGQYRALPPKELCRPWHHRERYQDQECIPAALFAGMYKFSTIAKDEKYIDWLNDIAQKCDYKLYKRIYHADDHCIGQLYLSLAQQYNAPKYYLPTKCQFDEIMTSNIADDWHWTWSDALFMSAPVWAKLSKITGDISYLEYMDRQYHMTYNELWSKTDSLFYRDQKYMNQQESNGNGVFWSRGNGWVFAGLTEIISDMPKDWPERDFYVELFKAMAVRLREIQREDGTWSAGLLGDLDLYENIETAGSAYVVYGLAWGVNNGILEYDVYEETVIKGWNALVGAVQSDSLFGYVQGVGSSPGHSHADYSELYGVGAFLSAGTEMYRFVSKD